MTVGGPAGLAFAIHYADLIKQHNDPNLPLKIILIEKANAIGNHTLSGAVINPASLREARLKAHPSLARSCPLR